MTVRLQLFKTGFWGGNNNFYKLFQDFCAIPKPLFKFTYLSNFKEPFQPCVGTLIEGVAKLKQWEPAKRCPHQNKRSTRLLGPNKFRFKEWVH